MGTIVCQPERLDLMKLTDAGTPPSAIDIIGLMELACKNDLCAVFLAHLQAGPSPKWVRSGGIQGYIILQP